MENNDNIYLMIGTLQGQVDAMSARVESVDTKLDRLYEQIDKIQDYIIANPVALKTDEPLSQPVNKLLNKCLGKSIEIAVTAAILALIYQGFSKANSEEVQEHINQSQEKGVNNE